MQILMLRPSGFRWGGSRPDATNGCTGHHGPHACRTTIRAADTREPAQRKYIHEAFWSPFRDFRDWSLIALHFLQSRHP